MRVMGGLDGVSTKFIKEGVFGFLFSVVGGFG